LVLKKIPKSFKKSMINSLTTLKYWNAEELKKIPNISKFLSFLNNKIFSFQKFFVFYLPPRQRKSNKTEKKNKQALFTKRKKNIKKMI